MTKALPNLLDFTLEEMQEFISSLGKEKFRAPQIMKWLYQSGSVSFDEMTTLSRDFRVKLSKLARISRPQIVKIQESKDGTKKALLRLEDGLFIESVLIPGKNNWTICVSTQAGCAMDCKFCLTARNGFKRNLNPSEIAGQLITLKNELPQCPEIKNIVMMGMGEPLANYDNVLKTIKNLTCDFGMGFSNRKITVSTCGLAPQIIRLGQDICINLAVSLNAHDNETRNKLMPVNKKYPLEVLLDACKKYPMPGRRLLTFEYILMDGMNSSVQDAKKLAALLKGQRCKLNLIVFNEYPESPFKSPQPKTVEAFQQTLIDHHYTTMLRKSKGSDILAACGQLSGSFGI
ncbi:MAG: 23S rRNA (adenine(2503)-C(2))-methyltransferase RlmN [Deltaproteobacteria bacterium HGW-Deltaproteobacteria-13]|jgi:23S rRNA (adenine2503-C2)-methyltransferase|nr:MAG: 23S rRNA (adenine(2503)-C(2))-methyltransferase RlmN [Deltaproteobacteria bacterium HGW-Deltaproteobacteria-13]